MVETGQGTNPGARRAAGVFISYRRDDTAGFAGRLYDDLTERFGAGSVFMDVDTIRPGQDFAEVLRTAVRQSGVLLAVIGPAWLTLTGPSGSRRLDDEGDFVRAEIETALQEGRLVIPVLVQGAMMPKAGDLPESLRPLAQRHAVEISHGRWRADVELLAESIAAAGLARPAPPVTGLRGGLAAPPARWLALGAAGLAAILAGLFALGGLRGGSSATASPPATATALAVVASHTPAPTTTPTHVATPVLSPSVAPTVEPSAAPSVAVTPAPTAYPDPIEQPPATTTAVTEYPNYGGEVDCVAKAFNGRAYSGNLKKMSAPDAKTVVFEFCNPNVAFLAQVAFASLGIDDGQYLIDLARDGALLYSPNGTGPYQFDSWDRGNRIDLTAFADYWGPAKPLTPRLEFQFNKKNAARYLALSSGEVDGIDNPGMDDLASIQDNPDLKLYPREGMNTMYLGMNNTKSPWTNQKVRQALTMGIDRERIVNNYYPPGSEVAEYFTPCSIPHGCEGTKAPAFNAAAAMKLLDEGLAEENIDKASLNIQIQYRSIAQSYIPDQTGVAQDLATQLQENLGLAATLNEYESTIFIDESNAGSLEGLFILGWGADFPDTSNFLSYHFGSGTGVKFGTPYPDLVATVTKGDQSVADADRAAAYAVANDLIVQYAPVVVMAHAGSSTAFQADVEGAHSSPLASEIFAVMRAADREIMTFMQGGEPSSLYCGDETDGESLRVCEQIKESLYAYSIGGSDVVPSLASSCSPSEDLRTWTCVLEESVKFHNEATLEASDVLLSYAAQWDAISPLHVGRTGAFEYWGALVGGGFLNPAGPCGLPNTPTCMP